MPSVVIIGSGISGLSLAYRLEQLSPDTDVTVLEADARPGGKIWTEREQGFAVEIGPNGFLDSKPTTHQLAVDIGLESQLTQASEAAGKNRYLFLDGKLQALPGGLMSFLSSRLLSWRGKLSLILERFRHRPMPEDESIDAFARRRTSAEIAATFADGLVTGIYAGDSKLLSLPACFPRIAALEREYGSVLKGFAAQAKKRRLDAKARGETPKRPGKLWSFRDGMRTLVESVVGRLKKPPVYGAVVRRLRQDGNRWLVEGEGAERWHADAVALTCPAPQQATMLADVDAILADEIDAIPYNRVAVIALGYRAADVPTSLNGFGFIAPQNTRRDLLGVQWCSSIYPGRCPEGTVLMRAMCGGWNRPDMLTWDDDRLLAAVMGELRLAQNINARPIFHRIVRWDRAIPQYHVGHLKRVERIDTRVANHAGLFLAGNAYRGVAMNDCVEQGQLVAEGMARYLSRDISR